MVLTYTQLLDENKRLREELDRKNLIITSLNAEKVKYVNLYSEYKNRFLSVTGGHK